MYLLLNLSQYVKSYGHLCQILAFFTMPAPQIWSCHMTQEANFTKFYFFLILRLIVGKVTKFLVEKLSTSEGYQPKTSRGWKTPPSAFRVKLIFGAPPHILPVFILSLFKFFLLLFLKIQTATVNQ